jgi:hypothetical protein
MNGVRAGFVALWVATALGAAGMVVTIASVMAEIGTTADRDLIWMFSLLATVAMAFATVGLLIARRQPGNRVAWVLMAAGPLIVLTFTGFAVGALRFAEFGSDDLVGGLAGTVAGACLGITLFVSVPLLAILFPDGRLPGPRWRVPVTLALVALVTYAVASLVQPGAADAELPVNPLGIESELVIAVGALLDPLLSAGVLAGAVMAIIAVWTRFRRSSGVERQQVKWFLAAVAAIAVLLPLSFNDTFLDSGGGFTVLDVLAMSSLALLPVAVGIAVLRYRLYEIDRIVSRTIGWALVTGLLVALFAAGVVVLQAVLSPVTSEDTLAVAVSTLVAFALFQPLRRRVQGAVDRRFDRARYDGERVAGAFADRLRDQVDLTGVERDFVGTVREALSPATSGVWIRGNRS